jgi:cytochrome c oxidase subunit 2
MPVCRFQFQLGGIMMADAYQPKKLRQTMKLDLSRVAPVAGAASVLMFSLIEPSLADQPRDWQVGFQDAATPVMEDLSWLHNSVLMPIITVVALFVLGLLVTIMLRFNAKANPTPAKFSHNTLIEVAWTIAPIFILMIIVIPSFQLLYKQDTIPEADLTIKAIGNQWYWTYEYPDHGDFSFDALLIQDADLKPGQPRLLATDNHVVVPVNKTVRVIVTAEATGVIHNWAIPAFGLKMDAVPGRLNETWFQATKEGLYYGQCSELCGIGHAYMPIAVEVVSEARFSEWVTGAQTEFGAIESPDSKFALNQN